MPSGVVLQELPLETLLPPSPPSSCDSTADAWLIMEAQTLAVWRPEA